VIALAAALEPGPTGDLAVAAEDYWHQRLIPIPLGGPDGRTPLVLGFTQYLLRPGLKTIRKWFSRRAVTGIGLVTGKLPDLAVIDGDDPRISLIELEQRCGQTPVRVMTPRGGDGGHLYYHYNGERCGNFGAEGLKIDIKGEGGYVVAPPSVRLTGENAGKAYSFAPGLSRGDVARRGLITPGSVPERPKTASSGDRVVQLRAVGVSFRNNTLFRSAMRCARSCGSEGALLSTGIEINSHFNPPLDRAEVEKTIHSAWGYEAADKNWFNNRSSRAVGTGFERNVLDRHPDAATLYPLLKHANGARNARGEPFVASPRAMAKARVIPEWGASYERYTHALAVLVETGFLLIVHRGGRYVGDTRKFTFPTTAPRFVVSRDVDLMRVVDALKGGLSIRKAADVLSMSKSRVSRLKRRAVLMGELKSVEVVGDDHAVPVPAHRTGVPPYVSKEDSHPPRRPPRRRFLERSLFQKQEQGCRHPS